MSNATATAEMDGRIRQTRGRTHATSRHILHSDVETITHGARERQATRSGVSARQSGQRRRFNRCDPVTFRGVGRGGPSADGHFLAAAFAELRSQRRLNTPFEISASSHLDQESTIMNRLARPERRIFLDLAV